MNNRHVGVVGVVGAGLAGVACAQALAAAGCTVWLFDKSRGVGGRMATRRASLVDNSGSTLQQAQALAFDHGAPGWSAHTPEFRHWLQQAESAGVVRRWLPQTVDAQGHAVPALTEWLGLPDMPALCRWWLNQPMPPAGRITLRTECAVDALARCADGWSLHSGGNRVADRLDAVVLAMPPSQAAALLQAPRADWAARAQAHAMSPCWTLMAVTDDPAAPHGANGPDWDVLQPDDGPLSLVVRQDRKPGRARQAGQAHWVAHATAAWSRAHLEWAPADVLSQMQQALVQAVAPAMGWGAATALAHGTDHPALPWPRHWHHAVVHRWRYAQAEPKDQAPSTWSWWDEATGLGVCGDFLGPGGVEGAFLSGRSVAAQLMRARCCANHTGQDGGPGPRQRIEPDPDAQHEGRAPCRSIE